MSSDESANDVADSDSSPEEGLESDQAHGTAASLSPKISLKLAVGAPHFALTLALSLIFMLANYLPLRGADLWLHVLYGDWILEHGRLPTAEPFMPFSDGLRLIDSQWLSQLLFAALENIAGPESISTAFAVVMLLAQIALARAIFVRTQSVAAAASGVVLFVLVGWSRLGALRPEILGLLLFSTLLLLLTMAGKREKSEGGFGWLVWLGCPLVFALWANLHGSFVCGLVVVGCVLCGEALEAAWRERNVAAVWRDERVRRRLVLVEVCVAATLLNPYGLDLLLYTLLFSGNENLKEVLEWQPMVILGPGGRSFAFAIVLLLLLMRHSRARVSTAEAIALFVFGLTAVMGIRMVTWFAPLFAYVAAPHLLDVCRQIWPPLTEEQLAELHVDPLKPPPGRSFHYSLACVVIAWMAFAISPSATPLLGGTPRTPVQLFGVDTPLGLSEHLREQPPSGPLLCPQQWSDWLVFDGPEGVRPFVTSNIHMAPRQVWVDYMAMYSNRASWDNMLERYRIGGVALDKSQHQNQIRLLRRSPDWRQTYEDRDAIFFRLATPSGETPPKLLAGLSPTLAP